ncbi:MAG TPA: alpha-L-arabinofuranosidase C-terminal domain-containing protein [Rhodothermales bacterium]|nr:alpha-L-arabinofuranosidase C-terminal domain-containing protein [Rhodothermales bacterium]
MNRLAPAALILIGLLSSSSLTPDASAQPTPTHTMVINADLGTETISRHIYGHFAEHLGRGIYDGFWTRSGTGEWHLRDDVIEALRQLRIPNLRWPGGCFADYYHWKDGIGPRDERPTIVNTLWGGITEDNSFGTHEFMELVDRLDTEPIIVGNVGSGTVQEMAQWWEYMNHPGPSPMADQRASNGQAEPWNVRYWGVGNESWGCGGNMTPEFYADMYKRFATFLHRYGDVSAFRIAAGPPGGNYDWMEVMMREAGSMMDGIDLHHYTINGSWATTKGHATDFSEADWFELMQRAWQTEELITRHSTIMDQYDPEKRVWLIVGEWGTWHQPAEGTNPGFLQQQNTLRDALVAGLSLNIFNQHADRVKMANIAQTINVLQAMILTEGDQMILTPTYHVFDLYKVHQDATLLPLSLDPGTYEFEGQSIPALSASASKDSTGTIHLTLVNLDPHQERTIQTTLHGQEVSSVTGRVLTATAMNAHNTFDQPDHVQPADFKRATLQGDQLTIRLPSKSIVALTIRE